MICSAIAVLASSVTGIGWYGEPLKQRGAGGAPGVPHSRVCVPDVLRTAGRCTLATLRDQRPAAVVLAQQRGAADRHDQRGAVAGQRAAAGVEDHARATAGVTISRVRVLGGRAAGSSSRGDAPAGTTAARAG